MFVVARRKGQRIVIGNDIEVIVTELSRSTVKLGVLAPGSLQILRGEIKDSIEAANRDAIQSAVATEGAFGPARLAPDRSLGLGVKLPTPLDVKEPTPERVCRDGRGARGDRCGSGPQHGGGVHSSPPRQKEQP